MNWRRVWKWFWCPLTLGGHVWARVLHDGQKRCLRCGSVQGTPTKRDPIMTIEPNKKPPVVAKSNS